MTQAINEAHISLDEFLKIQLTKLPVVDDFKLKVMFNDNNGVEEFWVKPFRNLGKDEFEGILGNEPEIIKSLQYGQIVSFTRNMITDWRYKENGVHYGRYIVCAPYKTIPIE